MTDRVGIERIGVYGGRAFLDVGDLAVARGLDPRRFENLLMRRKSIALPFEDPISFAVNAARPLVARLTEAELASIRLLIVASESGIDFGKSMGAYVHRHLGLDARCRQFEIKQACYGGTAALRMAAAWVASEGRRIGGGGRALVISTDLARPVRHSYAEPSQGSAAVALLVGPEPRVLELEDGASGVHTFEVADACRPTPEIETGDADLSLISYLQCAEAAFRVYREAVGPVDFREHFRALAFHTPFGGMVKGAHRTLMRKLGAAGAADIDADFERRLGPSLSYCREVGNVYSGTVFLALAGTLEPLAAEAGARIGLFSYGSGCCSEFYSGVVPAGAAEAMEEAAIADALAGRSRLSVERYDALLDGAPSLAGQRDAGIGRAVDGEIAADLYDAGFAGEGLLVLERIEGYRRVYAWS